MFLNVEIDESFDGGDAVERVQVKPLVLQRSPPRFDERVRETDLGHRKESLQRAGLDEFVDLAVDVLDASVCDERWRSRRRLDDGGGSEEDGNGVSRFEAIRNSPCEDPSREIVDDRMNVRLRIVEESVGTRIDMPEFVRFRRSNADLRFCRVNSKTRPPPAVLADKAIPGGSRGEDLPESLSKDGKSPGGDVTMFRRRHHLPDLLDLLRCQLMRRGFRTAIAILELTPVLGTSPRVIACWRNSQESECCSMRERAARTFDGAQNSLPRCGVEYSAIGQGEVRGPQDRDKNPEDCAELPVTSSKRDDFFSQLLPRGSENVQCDDVFVGATKPASSSRPRDAASNCQMDVARLIHQFLQAVIVDSLESCRCWHASIIALRSPG